MIAESQIPLDAGFLDRPYHFAQDKVVFLFSPELGQVAVDEEVPGTRIHRQKCLDSGGEGIDRPKPGANVNVGQQEDQLIVKRHLTARLRDTHTRRGKHGGTCRAARFEKISSPHHTPLPLRKHLFKPIRQRAAGPAIRADFRSGP